MSISNLGGSVWTVTANAGPFEAGLRRVEAQARRTERVVTNEFGTMTRTNLRRFQELNHALDDMSLRMDKVGKSTRFGLGLMAVGNTVDDLQYGQLA